MTKTKFNEIFVSVHFLPLVDMWHKFVNSTSKAIMLQYNKNSRLQKNLFIQKQNLKQKLKSC